MKRMFVALAFAACATAPVVPEGAHLEVRRAGSQPPSVGAPTFFTGHVVVTPLFQATASTRGIGASVTFDAGARSAWHTHPAGQTLIITEGTGWVQAWGQPKQELHPGDVVWTPPGVKHWHGATSTSAMTHLAIQEAVNGKVVEWMEHVTAEQYAQQGDTP